MREILKGTVLSNFVKDQRGQRTQGEIIVLNVYRMDLIIIVVA